MASASTTTFGPGIAALNTESSSDFLPIHDLSPQYRLPTELVQEIFLHLSPSDYDSARLVCRLWYQTSLRKSLLRSLLFEMEFNTFSSTCPCFIKSKFLGLLPPISTCPAACPCKYQFPDEPISTWDLRSLRVAFALALNKWPSRVRVSCGRLVIDFSTFLGNYNPDWGFSGPQREVESLCFSECSGSFVCTVTKTTGRHGEVERKLWIHRLFTSKYSPFNSFARQEGDFLYPVEGSRYLPGQLYMTMELTNFPGMPVVGLQVEEHLAFSAVKKIVINYANNKEEEITFNKFKLDRKNPMSDPSDEGTVFYDRNGTTYKSCRPSRSPAQQNMWGKPKPEPKNWASSFVLGKYLRFRKDIIIHTSAPKRANLATAQTSQRLLATIGDESLHQICYRVIVPLPPLRGGGYCSIIITPESSILVCAPSIDSSDPAAQNLENVHAWYKFSVPVRMSETTRPRITHLTVAPQYLHDFARGVWWMAICAAYDNGEVWLWQIDTEAFLRKEGMSDAVISPVNPPVCDINGPPLLQVPESTLAIQDRPGSTVHQAGESSSRPHTDRCVPHLRSGDFDEELGKCVSVNLCLFSGRTLSDNGSSPTKKLKVLLPTPVKDTDGFRYTRACKLGYMPNLEVLNFVGRGRTVLAGTKKEIVVWDMRLWRGLDRGKLNAEF